ncbi:MAG: tetratricopeptide repeat protein [Desulfomonile sp.]|nr:tetratricopeptide repeat protein [Desulfomonile sp.]
MLTPAPQLCSCGFRGTPKFANRNIERLFIRTTMKNFAAVGVLAAILLAIYLPNVGDSFVMWDLDAYRSVLESTTYFQTTWGLLTDFSGKVVSGYYAPLGSISLMMDGWIAGGHGPSPRTTLLVNIFLHFVNGLLVFVLINTLGEGVGVAWLAALIFLIHPLQVSSVLWFAQRKGLLATAFYLAAYLTYFKHRKTESPANYALSVALFGAGLLSKPTVVVFPVVLLATEMFLPTGAGNARGTGGSMQASRPLRKILLRLVPFFVISIVFAAVTVRTEAAADAADSLLQQRLLAAAAALWFYVGKVLFPVGLDPIYPRWNVDWTSVWWWLPLAGLLAAAVLIVWFRAALGGRSLWGAVNFVVPLLPMLGITRFSYMDLSYVADHFVYLAMMGAAYCMAVGITALRTHRSPPLRHGIAAAAAAYATFLGVQAHLQGRIWHDSVTFWTRNLQSNPDSWRAHTFLGHALLAAGRSDDAAARFRTALELRRSEPRVETGDAIVQANRFRSGLASAYYNLGNALLTGGRAAEAIQQLREAVRLNPGFGKAYGSLGTALLSLGDFESAEQHLAKAVEIDPANLQALCGLAMVLTEMGRPAAAVDLLSRELERSPRSVPMLNNLALAYLRLGRVLEAIAILQRAAVVAPHDPGTQQNLRLALEQARNAESKDGPTAIPTPKGGP